MAKKKKPAIEEVGPDHPDYALIMEEFPESGLDMALKIEAEMEEEDELFGDDEDDDKYEDLVIADHVWDDDRIQFPRLIAEMKAAGFFDDKGKMEALCASMDLDEEDVLELVERAQEAWDLQKAKTKPDGPKQSDENAVPHTYQTLTCGKRQAVVMQEPDGDYHGILAGPEGMSKKLVIETLIAAFGKVTDAKLPLADYVSRHWRYADAFAEMRAAGFVYTPNPAE